LCDVSLTLERGEVLGLVGPNRAGKTTLIKLFLSLCWPSTGRIWRFGQPAYRRDTLARVGYVPEHTLIPLPLQVRHVLTMHGSLLGLPPAAIRRQRDSVLAQCGLEAVAHQSADQLSKGMLVRLALACALLGTPELLVLDEPFEGLDVSGQEWLRATIARHKSLGGSVLLVSHNGAEIERQCDRVALLDDGRLVYCGAVPGLRAYERGRASGSTVCVGVGRQEGPLLAASTL